MPRTYQRYLTIDKRSQRDERRPHSLANAYGTVPHKLIEAALEHYHIPEKIARIVRDYLERIHLRFRVGDYITAWQRLGKGIVTGCTISVILFVMAMNLMIEAGKRETRGPKTKANIRQRLYGRFNHHHTHTGKMGSRSHGRNSYMG